MAILKLAALSALGYAAYRYVERRRGESDTLVPAGAGHKSAHKSHTLHKTGLMREGRPEIRDAGPDAMQDKPHRAWTRTDQASDESFPASDPPATY